MVLEARGLTKSFGGRPAVEDVTFRVPPGEVVGFLGPNGAGKTTTIRLLLGLLRPAAGAATRPDRVGYLPELHTGYDALAVRSYLRFMARMRRVPRADVDDEAERVIDALALGELADRPMGRLSKGQRQRAGIAQALLGAPDAYVLDEPTIGLDPAQVGAVRRLFRSLAADGAAVLLSTHLLAEAAAVCDRVVVITNGRIVADEAVVPDVDLEARFLQLVGGAALS